MNRDDERQLLLDWSITVTDLGDIRRQVAGLARGAGLSVERAEDLATAVNEAATNAIEHAGGHGDVIVVKDDHRCLIVEVSDHGPGIPASATGALPPVEATDGRGLWLARTLTDHTEFESDGRGTTVRLEMKLQLP